MDETDRKPSKRKRTLRMPGGQRHAAAATEGPLGWRNHSKKVVVVAFAGPRVRHRLHASVAVGECEARGILLDGDAIQFVQHGTDFVREGFAEATEASSMTSASVIGRLWDWILEEFW
ncbi:hypothetical protein AXG93_641s1070 [Marchantia polymorpha subsp. ruderalis]|uniref:Uncharacterized protein n=1 Tax=Marchantia polymorpha subsp. ruderalis TaxID=1480154 RepID=A0A176W3A6_MARPO|nr:hypothetical protein AXG93_641s1070 [Marchantia polymorpha subsp. ruderalis]